MDLLKGKMMETQNSGREPGSRADGGTVNPPCNRKGRAGNPPPKGKANRASSTSTKLQQIAERARNSPEAEFTSLAHLLDTTLLSAAYQKTRKDAAPGIDGCEASEYGRTLQANLEKLIERVKAGRYRAPGVRRVHIPKGQGETRPIGIPTLEDKVLQRGVAMILGTIYEEDFYEFSYGFRPKRSPHDAIDALRAQIMAGEGCWIVEADIRKFFDSLDHAHIREILRRRIRDGAILRLIHKWLKAGVFEEGQVTYPETGTPQGGVISPLIANAVLHVILDEWFVNVVQPRLHGRSFLIRFADDFVIGVSTERDAQTVFGVLPKRFGRFDLQLHPEKSGLIDFRRPPFRGPKKAKDHKSKRTFNFLGFTWYWSRTRRGGWAVKLRTARDRTNRTLRGINEWCRRHRHDPVWEQHATLCLKLRGHYNFYGVISNWRCLYAVLYHVRRLWRKWLDRRSQKARMNWEKYVLLLKRYPLPLPNKARRYRA